MDPLMYLVVAPSCLCVGGVLGWLAIKGGCTAFDRLEFWWWEVSVRVHKRMGKRR